MPPRGGCGIPRLRWAQLGLAGRVVELDATADLSDAVLLVRIAAVRGTVESPFLVMQALMGQARVAGATRLRVEGLIANPRLLAILVGRYGFVSTTNGEVLEVEVR